MVQDVEKRNKSYKQYVENGSNKAGCVYNCFKAFITGGIICTIGQLIMNFMKMTGMTADDAASYTTLILVALSVIFTGFGIYPLITSFGGAGALVPITGFANSIASPAIEYKKEGQVFGNIYDSRTGYIVWNIFQLDYRSDILDNKSYVINYLEVLRKWQ